MRTPVSVRNASQEANEMTNEYVLFFGYQDQYFDDDESDFIAYETEDRAEGYADEDTLMGSPAGESDEG